jgi:serine/threonine protein phosphatase 1
VTQVALKLIENLDIPVVFLGDYCDRGTSTVKTVDLLIEGAKKRPDWIFLTGNHELILTESFEKGEQLLADSKFLAAYDEYKALGAIPATHLRFINSLRPYYESQSLLFVHGGIAESASVPIHEIPVYELVWTYDISPDYKGKKIVRGHFVVDCPEEFSNHISLDTGVGYGKKLSIGILDDSPRRRGRRLLGWIQMDPLGELIEVIQLSF